MSWWGDLAHKLIAELRAVHHFLDTADKLGIPTSVDYHDLRHEAGSRMLEAGWPLHHLQEMLGHADLKQTSTYLNVTRSGLQESMKRFGTAPLHVVAPEADQEHSPSCNDVSESEKQVTVN